MADSRLAVARRWKVVAALPQVTLWSAECLYGKTAILTHQRSMSSSGFLSLADSSRPAYFKAANGLDVSCK